MADAEQIEKVRQEIMRFRELLNVMREKLAEGEQAYAKLFSSLMPEDIANMKEKDVQWKLAEMMVADVSSLGRAVSRMRYEARVLERDFEELYDIIAAAQNSE